MQITHHHLPFWYNGGLQKRNEVREHVSVTCISLKTLEIFLVYIKSVIILKSSIPGKTQDFFKQNTI